MEPFKLNERAERDQGDIPLWLAQELQI